MSKLTKRISAIVAILLSICLVFALFGFVGCGTSEEEGGNPDGGTTEGGDTTTEDEDLEFASFYAETTFGVAFIVGASFNISNVNVYGVWADDGTSTCISGMRADSAYSDTVVMIDADGNEIDAIEITSDEMTITLKYTGTKYTVSEESARTFTFTLSANYADKAEVYPYTLGMNNAVDYNAYAGVGDGASAMSVAVYYTAYSSWSGKEEQSYDTHADATILVNGSADGVLAVGDNTISATSVCKTSDGNNVAISDVYLTIAQNQSGTYTYTAYSDSAKTNVLYSYDLNSSYEIDFSEFYASTTFGVAFIVGASFSMSNVNVYGVWADDGTETCISGMRADDQFADTVVLLNDSGQEVDSLTITSDEMEITLKYTGTKYGVTEESRTFTFTLSANYATSAEVVPYLMDRGSITSYAKVGDGADAFSVVVYYDGGSDDHADSTITITNDTYPNGDAENAVLTAGKNKISATTVCKAYDESTKAATEITIDDVYLNIEKVTVGKTDAYKYTAYSDGTTQDATTLLYTYTIDEKGSDVYAVLETDDSYMYGGFLEITDIVITLYYDGSCSLDCSFMDGYTNWSWSISDTTFTAVINSLGGSGTGTITFGSDGSIVSIVFSSFGGTTFEAGSEMTFTPVAATA